MERFATTKALFQTGVVPGHHFLGYVVTDRPEAHYQCFSAGQKESSPQPVYPFAIAHLAEASIAGRKRHQLGSPEVQVGGLQGRQNAVLAAAFVQIGAAQGQSRP